MTETNRETWITDRPVTDGPGQYSIVAVARGRKFIRPVASNVDRDEAMGIIALHTAATAAVVSAQDKGDGRVGLKESRALAEALAQYDAAVRKHTSL